MRHSRNKKTCHKVGYHTKAEAEQALKDFGRARGSVRVYHCQHHNESLWHLTSQEKCNG